MRRIAAVALFLLLWAAPAPAQLQITPDRLPPDTVFYMHWHGLPPPGAPGADNLFTRLWNDSEFRPARDAIRQALLRELGEATLEGSGDPVLEILRGQVLFGFHLPPEAGAEDAVAKPADFFIADLSRQPGLLSRLLERRNKEKEVVRDTFSFRDLTIEEVVRPAAVDTEAAAESPKAEAGEEQEEAREDQKKEEQVHYRAVVGEAYVRASTRAAIEDLLTRLTAAAPPAAALAQNALYQKTRRETTAGGLLTMFAHIPWTRLIELMPAQEPQPNRPDPATVLQGLEAEKIHGLHAQLRSAGDTATVNLSVFGDLSPGSVFDLLGAGLEDFETLALAPPGVYSYTVTAMELSTFYQWLSGVLKDVLPAQQAAMVGVAENLAVMRLGMTISEALALFGPEFATVQTQASLDPFGSVSELVAFTIHNPTGIRQLLQNGLGEMLSEVQEEGEVTYFTAAIPRGGTPFHYHLALTPRFLLGAPKAELVREAVGRLSQPDAASLGSDAGYQKARSQVPARVVSFAYSDMTKVDWDAVLDQFQQSLQKNYEERRADWEQQQQENPEHAGEAPSPPPDVRRWVTASLLRRYLRTSWGGCWKGSDGLRCEFVQQ